MVKLCTNTYDVHMLEWALKKHDIQYEIDVDAPDCGLEYPYLIVDGVPLDMGRAFKWIEGYAKNE